MKERPIIFSSEMVKAILDGRKTQTRRPIKDPRKNFTQYNRGLSIGDMQAEAEMNLQPNFPCPYGQPGDRLWVREGIVPHVGHHGRYKADGEWIDFPVDYKCNYTRKIIPSIFMPRWASRISLEIVHVRVNRLLIISEDDCDHEGCPWNKYSDLKHKVWFEKYWDSLYIKKPEYQWPANPWVWVIEFRKINPNHER